MGKYDSYSGGGRGLRDVNRGRFDSGGASGSGYGKGKGKGRGKGKGTKGGGNVQFSKFLSSLLRHGNDGGEGVKPDSGGWISVDRILRMRMAKSRGGSLEVLKKVVENCDKQRFQIEERESGDFIRATQGHSKKVQVREEELLTPVNPSDLKVCVHGTYYNAYYDHIQQEGMKTMNRHHMHFQDEENFGEVQSGFRQSAQVAIYIDVPRAVKAGVKFLKSSNGVILTSGINDKIPPRLFLKVVDLKKDGCVIWSPEKEKLDKKKKKGEAEVSKKKVGDREEKQRAERGAPSGSSNDSPSEKVRKETVPKPMPGKVKWGSKKADSNSSSRSASRGEKSGDSISRSDDKSSAKDEKRKVKRGGNSERRSRSKSPSKKSKAEKRTSKSKSPVRKASKSPVRQQKKQLDKKRASPSPVRKVSKKDSSPSPVRKVIKTASPSPTSPSRKVKMAKKRSIKQLSSDGDSSDASPPRKKSKKAKEVHFIFYKF